MNLAHKIASGDWIAVMDADDAFLPGRVSKLINAGEKYNVDLVADNQIIYDSFEDKYCGTLFEIDEPHLQLDLPCYLRSIEKKVDFGSLKPVIRRYSIQDIGVKYNENARFSQDFYFLLELLLTGARAIVVAEPLYKYTLPFSKKKKKWTLTGAGAWRHDFAGAFRTNESYLADARVLGNPQAFEMLTKKSVIIEKNLKWNVLKRKTLDAGMLDAMSYALTNPGILKIMFERMLRGRFSA